MVYNEVSDQFAIWSVTGVIKVDNEVSNSFMSVVMKSVKTGHIEVQYSGHLLSHLFQNRDQQDQTWWVFLLHGRGKHAGKQLRSEF